MPDRLKILVNPGRASSASGQRRSRDRVRRVTGPTIGMPTAIARARPESRTIRRGGRGAGLLYSRPTTRYE